MPIKNGDKVKVEYIGTLDDGTVFDSSKNHGEPLEVEVGSGKIIPGFENALIGMDKGEEKKIDLNSSETYGEHNPEFTKRIPRNQLPKEPKPKAGMVLALTTPDGKKIPARISEVTDNNITIDLNHPLAGKNLHFAIKIVDVVS